MKHTVDVKQKAKFFHIKSDKIKNKKKEKNEAATLRFRIFKQVIYHEIIWLNLYTFKLPAFCER